MLGTGRVSTTASKTTGPSVSPDEARAGLITTGGFFKRAGERPNEPPVRSLNADSALRTSRALGPRLAHSDPLRGRRQSSICLKAQRSLRPVQRDLCTYGAARTGRRSVLATLLSHRRCGVRPEI